MFLQAVRGVEPIHKETPARPPPVPQGATQPDPQVTTPVARQPDRRPRPEPRPASLTEHHRGRAPGLDRKTALRLGRGAIPIDAIIDLHGKSQEDAYQTLIGFIRDSHAGGRRCVLVITGKGRGTVDQDDIAKSRIPGVLRRKLPGWISDPEIAGMVLAHAPATPAHGGDGARYVLLRRRRQPKEPVPTG